MLTIKTLPYWSDFSAALRLVVRSDMFVVCHGHPAYTSPNKWGSGRRLKGSRFRFIIPNCAVQYPPELYSFLHSDRCVCCPLSNSDKKRKKTGSVNTSEPALESSGVKSSLFLERDDKFQHGHASNRPLPIWTLATWSQTLGSKFAAIRMNWPCDG